MKKIQRLVEYGCLLQTQRCLDEKKEYVEFTSFINNTCTEIQ